MSRRSVQEVGYSHKLRVTPEDDTPNEFEIGVARGVKVAIEAMFGHARMAEGPSEIGAYIYTPLWPFLYDVLRNGYWEMAGAVSRKDEHIETQRNAAIERSLGAIKLRFPDSRTEQLVWRMEPEFRELGAQRAEAKWGLPALPDRVHLYLRFTVTPLGVHGYEKSEHSNESF